MGKGAQMRVPAALAVRIAMDTNDHGSKHHSGFRSVDELIKYDAWRRTFDKTYHYEIILNTSDLTHIFFDLERPFTEQEQALPSAQLDTLREAIVRAFMQHAEAALSELLRSPIQLVPGSNCQISTSSYPHRFSCHAVMYMKGCTMALSGKFADIVDARILSLATDDPHHSLMVYQIIKGGVSVTKTVVDTGIYEKSRCFRLLFSSKKKPPSVPLVPFLGSSASVLDHLVNVHPSTCPPDGMTLLPTLDVAMVDEAVPPRPSRTQSCVGSSRLARPREDHAHVRACWQPGDIAIVRSSLLAGKDVARVMKLECGKLCFESDITM